MNVAESLLTHLVRLVSTIYPGFLAIVWQAECPDAWASGDGEAVLNLDSLTECPLGATSVDLKAIADVNNTPTVSPGLYSVSPNEALAIIQEWCSLALTRRLENGELPIERFLEAFITGYAISASLERGDFAAAHLDTVKLGIILGHRGVVERIGNRMAGERATPTNVSP